MIDDELKYVYCSNNPEVFSELVVAIYEQAMDDYKKSIETLSNLLHKKREHLTKDNLYKIIEAERLMHDVDIFLNKHLYNISEDCCKEIYKKLHSYLDNRFMVVDYVYGKGTIWKDYQERLSGKRPRKLEVKSTRSHS